VVGREAVLTHGLELQWREMRKDDYSYVLSSWLRSYARSSEFWSLPLGVYYALYQPVVKVMLDRSTVAIAFTPDLPDTIVGWTAIEGDDTLHYFVTKSRFRRMGVATWMLKDLRELPAVYTHRPTSLAVMRVIGPSWTYDGMRRFPDRKAA
jgi:hypothetical protein